MKNNQRLNRIRGETAAEKFYDILPHLKTLARLNCMGEIAPHYASDGEELWIALEAVERSVEEWKIIERFVREWKASEESQGTETSDVDKMSQV
jgi:hypothetical protein